MSQTDPLKDRVYFSQNREDLILDAFFPDVEKGFYVDVGANDPMVDSVTKLFYDKGWRGINVEPLKHHWEALKSKRKRDINLNIGLGDKNASLTFHEFSSGDGLSTFSDEIVNEYSGLQDDVHTNTKEYTVDIKTMRDVLKENKVDKIQFLKVDVEGLEYEVLDGNDWDSYRPQVICIEANHIVKDWRPLLKEKGYELAFFDGLNNYYTDSKTTRRKKFDYVKYVVIEKNGGIRQDDFNLINSLRNKEIENEQAIMDAHLRLQTALAENPRQNELYHALQAENHNNHVRAAVAERALRSPVSFIKYQLKRVHRVLVYRLSIKKPTVAYTKNESETRTQLMSQVAKAKNDSQLLEITQKIAALETARLERIHKNNTEQPFALRVYMRFVKSLKRLRMRTVA
jgi:FkbM family methyltransferase